MDYRINSMPVRINNSKSSLILHFTVFLFGLVGVIGKMLTLPALFIVFARALIAALSLIIIRIVLRKTTVITVKGLVSFSALGLLLAVHWVMFFYAIQISSVAIGLISISSFPIFVAFLEPIFFREKLRVRSVVVACVVFGGLLFIAPKFDFTNRNTLGITWGTLAALAFALLAIVNRLQSQHYSPVMTALWQNGFAAIFLFPLVISSPPVLLSLNDIGMLLILGVLCTALAHTLFIYSLTSMKAQFASIVTTLEPIYGITLGWLLLAEQPSIKTSLGGLIIIGAVAFESYAHAREQQSIAHHIN